VVERRLAARAASIKKAIVAVAHAILVTAYHLLARQTPYQDPGADYFGSISNARWMISMRGAPGEGRRVAFSGSVGISSRS
jgi:hypothetical protein